MSFCLLCVLFPSRGLYIPVGSEQFRLFLLYNLNNAYYSIIAWNDIPRYYFQGHRIIGIFSDDFVEIVPSLQHALNIFY